MAAYARELRPSLPEATGNPARSRVLWMPFHLTVITLSAWALATGRVPWPLWPVVSLVIGCCMAGTTFLGHETMHGAVVRGGTAIRLIGLVAFLPFCMSPKLWVAWHNRVHHNHCAKPGVDPDMYPTFEQYQNHRSARIMADYFGIGRRRIMSLLSLAFGFTGQSAQILYHARSCGYLTKQLHRRAIMETLFGIAFWITVAMVVGFLPFLFIYALPLIVVNSIVMMFIMTNHNLSPLTPTNDPLVNSLSVTLPRVLEWLSLHFGYHVEHHVFPTISNRHGAVMRAAIRARYPERYQSMPMTRALRKLYTTARVYKDDTTLYDPPSGMTWSALLPSAPLAPSVPAQR